jgi:NTE family protein
MKALKELVGDRRIEDLPIKYTAVAADIRREKEVWLKEGSLFDAIRASVSLPLFLTPFEINGVKLLDGGILNPVPIAPTFEDHTDLTIAVNLGGPPAQRPRPEQQTTSESEGEPATEGVRAKINKFIESLTSSLQSDDSDSWQMLSIANQTFDAMQGAIARQKLAAYPPDHTIMIPRNACGTMDFDRAGEMIKLGYESAADYLL